MSDLQPRSTPPSSLRAALVERWFDTDDEHHESVTDEQILARIEDLVGEGWHHAGKEMERAQTLLGYLEEVKRLTSDPFASDAVALRACLLAANEALGLPGPQPSPEREIARAIIKEAQGTS